MKKVLLFAFASMIAISSSAQDELRSTWWLTAGPNFRLPPSAISHAFPFMRTKKTAGKKLTLGGLGIGLSSFMNLSPKLQLRSSGSFSRQAYWNESYQMNKGPNPQDALGYLNSFNFEYYLEARGVLHYMVTANFSVGTGLGFEFLLVSKTSLDFDKNLGDKPEPFTNYEYKTVMPVVPVEVAWCGRKIMFGIRGEAGVLNRYKKDLTEFGPNVFGLLTFEAGVKL